MASRLDDAYWGGYTAKGELLHLAATGSHGHARSACGRWLAEAFDIPASLHGARCRSCEAIEQAWEHDELADLLDGAGRG